MSYFAYLFSLLSIHVIQFAMVQQVPFIIDEDPLTNVALHSLLLKLLLPCFHLSLRWMEISSVKVQVCDTCCFKLAHGTLDHGLGLV